MLAPPAGAGRSTWQGPTQSEQIMDCWQRRSDYSNNYAPVVTICLSLSSE
jgi:hypothetical protein